MLPGAPWTIGIIVDSTLHIRSSDHVHNASSLTNSAIKRGFIDGHRWTNVLLLINDRVVPLPPVPHYTRDECKTRGTPYLTEIERITAFLKTLQLWEWAGHHDPSEVIVLGDGAYEGGKFHQAIRSRGWDFLTRICKGRVAQPKERSSIHILRNWLPLPFLFSHTALKGNSPWQTVRTLNSRGPDRKKRRMDFRIRSLQLIVRGSGLVRMVCSEHPTVPGWRFIACSNERVDPRLLFRLYRKRWLIEVFHKAVKSYLGMEHAGVWDFDSLQAHMHWVYTVYLLLMSEAKPTETLFDRQVRVQERWKVDGWQKIIHLSTRYGGVGAIRDHCHAAMGRLLAA